MKTLCLKCGEPHYTGDFPIKDKIEDPICINCHQHGHFASNSRCPKFPKLKYNKGETIKNKNKNEIAKTSNIIRGLSFTQALSNDSIPQASPLDLRNSAPEKSNTE
ncbi:hypothetical protein TNIN_68751 [Trichonephila inaurata madagascariensis]|uniref:Uncharacterized protein n=1 Tax=Trichonephila inaurata madagascariensis TaxID=2747483 RepID=A0A8X7CJB8_9ARAC|nr:hypothetical protein TNIN_68751 [Trichonephila inaurata madagascariensis]